MSLAQTKAATIIEEKGDQLTSHQVISLLMDGALERVGQAKICLQTGNDGDADVLIAKLVGIINGLRGSLNVEQGGEIADNLDALYGYMVERLGEDNRSSGSLDEVQRLMSEVKTGWDGIDSNLSAAS